MDVLRRGLPVDFRLLGRTEAWHGKLLLPLGSGRHRFFLAVLLLAADRLPPLSRLVDALWDDPPPTARAQMHNMISDLRRRLRTADDGLIVTHSTGYELRLGTHGLDVAQ